MKFVIYFLPILFSAFQAQAYTNLTCTAEVQNSTVGNEDFGSYVQMAPDVTSVKNKSLLSTKINTNQRDRHYNVLKIDTSVLKRKGAEFVLNGTLKGQTLNVTVQMKIVAVKFLEVSMLDSVSKEGKTEVLDTSGVDDGSTMRLENKLGRRLSMNCYFIP